MPTAELIRNLLAAAVLLPLVSSVLVIFFGRRFMGHAAGWFATAMMAGSFGCSLAALFQWLGQPTPVETINWTIPWIPIPGAGTDAGWLYLGIMADSLTMAMIVMVTGIATLVHLYSIGYMAGDKRFERFFAYLSLFSFSMLGIVVANSLMMLFVFWELVGLTSYLLIGFWFEKRGPQLACKKAFVMNRVGDMGFLIGFGILFYQLGGRVLLPAAPGSANLFESLIKPVTEGGLGLDVMNPPLWLTAAGIGLFFGAIGKSAQFPLHTWLPDAMEGPTPVSSIVHSATMVAAGVYLTARIYPILTPGAHLFVATIGLITLVIAACMALVMTDIKRVLAYSTLSQLGYMVLGLGAGAYSFALFHLITHAFFKCCLFQCAGSVIHAAHHQQDMRSYGGLLKKMPVTALCFLICTLAIAGASIPFTNIGMSGFYSKDGIIAGAFNYSEAMTGAGYGLGMLFAWGPLAVAYLTVFYMGRAFTLTFLGQPRDQHLHDNAHDAPWQMVVPQVVLAAMAVLSAPMILPFFELIAASAPKVAYVQPSDEKLMEHAFHLTHAGLGYGISWIVVLLVAIGLYLPGMKYASRIAALPGINIIHTWFLNKFYFDGLYDLFGVGLGKVLAYILGWIDKYLVDGLVNLAALLTRFVAWASGMFDNRVVDGAVNGAALAAQGGGEFLRSTQTGRVRSYALVLFASAALVTIIVAAVALVAG